jgi:hypothetical protein
MLKNRWYGRAKVFRHECSYRTFWSFLVDTQLRFWYFQVALKGVLIGSFEKGGIQMGKNINRIWWKSNISYGLVMLLFAGLVLLPAFSLAINHPTSNPYEIRPAPDGSLAYRIIPTWWLCPTG